MHTPESIESFYSGTRVVVTGGLGFIGSNLARRLVELGSEVLVVDSLVPNTGGNLTNLADIEDKLRIELLDMSDESRIAKLLTSHDIVFNLAGKSSHVDSMTDPIADLSANVSAHIVLLEAVRRVIPRARVVFSSTRQIYGRPISCPVNEDHPIRPLDVNGINKAAGENYHTLYHQIYGLQTVCLRLTNTFGPRMRVKDARQNFLGIWLRRVLEDDALEIWGGQQTRDLTYIDDAVDALLAAGASTTLKNRIFNIGGSPPISLVDLAELLVSIAGSGRYELKQFPSERLRIDVGDYFADDQRFRDATGWAPKIALPEALQRSVEFFRERLKDYV